jgi:hypothetical protein
MPYHLSLIWSKNVPIPASVPTARHWSLYLRPTTTTKGVKYEVMVDDWDIWSYNCEMDVDPRQVGGDAFGGKMVLSEMADDKVKQFETIATDMTLPSAKAGENCQDWVRAVVNVLVDEGIIEKIALLKMECCHK